jgi:hypothetical protein
MELNWSTDINHRIGYRRDNVSWLHIAGDHATGVGWINWRWKGELAFLEKFPFKRKRREIVQA